MASAGAHPHLTGNHSAGEVVAHDPQGGAPPAHTTTAERLHNDLRRAALGVWHWSSETPLDRDLGEITWRRTRTELPHLHRIAAGLASGAKPLPFDGLAGQADMAPLDLVSP